MILALQIGFLEITWVDLVDILLVSGLLYQVYKLMQGTLAIRIFMGFVLLYFVYLLVKAARMELLSIVLGQFAGVGVIALIVLFQQEIRRFLFLLGKTTTLGRHSRLMRNFLIFFGRQDHEIRLNISEILSAVETMAEECTGALIIISRDSPLSGLSELGDRLDAHISKRLLLAIFNKAGPMHDGAVIIYENKIAMARCILPISEKADMPPQFGTRHRAALGLSEQGEILAIVVSEETGQISIIQEETIHPNISPQELRQRIQTYMEGLSR